MVLLILITIFILFSIVINTYPAITLWDRCLILNVQNILQDVPKTIPIAFDSIFYSVMIIIPLVFIGLTSMSTSMGSMSSI